MTTGQNPRNDGIHQSIRCFIWTSRRHRHTPSNPSLVQTVSPPTPCAPSRHKHAWVTEVERCQAMESRREIGTIVVSLVPQNTPNDVPTHHGIVPAHKPTWLREHAPYHVYISYTTDNSTMDTHRRAPKTRVHTHTHREKDHDACVINDRDSQKVTNTKPTKQKTKTKSHTNTIHTLIALYA